MNLKSHFKLTSVSGKIPRVKANPFEPIDILVGTWEGRGFNQIWRPHRQQPGDPPNQDRFLELNETSENLQFDIIPGDIPNRGLLQEDINLNGIRYLQQVSDANVLGDNGLPAAIHIENGMWLTIPQTTNPADAATVARMGNIPHGTAFVAQGSALPDLKGPPPIAKADITPFVIGQPANLIKFPEPNLANPSPFRTGQKDIPNVTQAMVDNPNSVLTQAIAGQNIILTKTLKISTSPLKPPTTGGGLSNIAFLDGAAAGANAKAAQMEATFWVETVQMPDGTTKMQLQYTQTVLLNFNGLSWPHVSVATLIKTN